MPRQPPEAQTVTSEQESDREHRDYWEHFYASPAATLVPHEPSNFARWVARRESPGASLVDVGTGSGRDALWFSRQGFSTLGLDYAQSALDLAAQTARAEDLSASFRRLNLYHSTEVAEAAEWISASMAPTVLYARFLIHAMEDAGRLNLWSFARATLRPGRAYLEFRTTRTHYAFGEHYRHFVEPQTVADELEAAGGVVEHLEEGYGLAVYKNEDPRVCRIVVRW
jgi:hypothetical protein